MNELNQEPSQNTLPFNNLFLISGLVNGFNKTWMYLSSILFLILGYLIFQLIIFFPLLNRLISNGYSRAELELNPNLIFDSAALKLDKNIIIALELGMFVFAFIGLFVGLKFIHHKSISSVLTGFQKFRLKRFYYAFAIWGLLILIFLSINFAVDPSNFKFQPDWSGLIISFLILIFLMPIQTGCEEILFRGYLMQGLAQVFKNGIIPLLITSLLFGAAHMGNPEVKKHGWEIMLFYYVCFALFMGGISLLDEGLELAFGIHFANNLISSILINTPNSVVKTYALFETQTENPQIEILIWFAMAFICFFVFKIKYKWKNFQLILK